MRAAARRLEIVARERLGRHEQTIIPLNWDEAREKPRGQLAIDAAARRCAPPDRLPVSRAATKSDFPLDEK